jgi:hypothetical protein
MLLVTVALLTVTLFFLLLFLLLAIFLFLFLFLIMLLMLLFIIIVIELIGVSRSHRESFLVEKGDDTLLAEEQLDDSFSVLLSVQLVKPVFTSRHAINDRSS